MSYDDWDDNDGPQWTVHAFDYKWKIIRETNARKWWVEYIGPGSPPEIDGLRFFKTRRARFKTLRDAVAFTVEHNLRHQVDQPNGTQFDNRLREALRQ